jgi:guanylate kinase
MPSQKPKIFIISGPSGAGEDSIIKGLKKHFSVEKVVTTTTREMRIGEAQGNPYYFISKEKFSSGVKNGEFFEYAEEDRGNFYGVTKKEMQRALSSNKPVIWKLDYKGAIAAKKLIPASVTILIDAPLEVIEKRIRRRDIATDEYVKIRLEYAKGWYENRDKFDYSVKNEEGKLDEAVKEVAGIIKGEYEE